MALAKTQIIRVLGAVQGGARTSAEIEKITGIPLHVVSAYLCQLRREGKVTSVRLWKRGIVGQRTFIWEPVQ